MNNNSILLTINGQNNTGPAFSQVGQQAQQAAQSVKQAWGTIGNSMKSVGRTMTATITAPIVGIVGSSVKVASEFEAIMKEVKAISGATGEEYQDLTEKAKKLGETTRFTARDIASTYKVLSMAGWSTQQQLNGIEGMTKLGAISGGNIEGAADVITNIIGALHLQAEDANQIADSIAAAATNSKTSVEGIGESMKNVGAAAGGFNYNYNDLLISLGLLGNIGIEGSEAGTTLSRMFDDLSKASGDSKKMMDKLGISIKDQNGNFKSWKQVMDNLRQSTANLTDEEKQEVAQTIFNVRSKRAALAIMNATEESYNKLTSAVYSASDGMGDAARMSEEMLDSLEGQITILKSAWEGFQMKIADSVMPTIAKLVLRLQNFMNWLNNLNPKIIDFAIKIGLVVAAIGPLLWIGGQMITTILAISNGIKALKTAFMTLKAAMAAGTLVNAFNPTLWIIAAISVAVVGLAALIIFNWDKVKKWTLDAVEKIKAVWNFLTKDIKQGVEDVKSAIKDALKDAGVDVDGITQKVEEVSNKCHDSLLGVFENIGWGEEFEKSWNNVKNFNLLDKFNLMLGPANASNAITKAVSPFIERLLGDKLKDFNPGKKIRNFFWDISSTIRMMGVQFKNGDMLGLGNSAVKVIDRILPKSVGQKLGSRISNLLTSLGLNKKVQNITSWVTTHLKGKTSQIRGFFNTLGNNITTTINNLKNKIKGIIDKAIQTVKKTLDGVLSIVKSVIRKVQQVFNGMQSFLSSLMSRVRNIFSSGFNFVKSTVDGIFDSIKGIYSKIQYYYNKIVTFIRVVLDIVDNFKQAYNDIMDKIVEVFSHIYEQYTTFINKFERFVADMKKNLTDFINAIINGINHLTAGINTLHISLQGIEALGIPPIEVGFNIPKIPNLPSLSVGTSEVLSDGLAVIHKGEAVVPAKVNPWNSQAVAKVASQRPQEVIHRFEGTDQPIIIELDGRVVAETVIKRTAISSRIRG